MTAGSHANRIRDNRTPETGATRARFGGIPRHNTD
jgi:hypothetical protein